MFKFSPLLIALLVLPSCLSADVPALTVSSNSAREMCGESWKIAQSLAGAHQLEKLKGLLLQKGLTIASADERISRRVLDQAARAWNLALGQGTVRVAESASDSDVIVESVDQLGSSDDQQGEIEVYQQENGRLSANISINVNVNAKSGDLSSVAQGAVLTHELGHLFGLDDSENPGAIMGTFDGSHLVTEPSQDEVKAIRALRAFVGESILKS